ncbi:MAG: hypothetical protein WEB88_08565 [Gemmatimonadota bacterium]
MSRDTPAPPEEDRHAAAHRLAREVEALPGVRDATVVLGGAREVTELRIRAAAGAAHAILTNAAGHVLRHGGYDFAPEAIRVVSASAEATRSASARPPRPEPPGSNGRPAAVRSRYLVLSDLSVVRSGPRVTCTVRLRRGEALFEGSGEELDSEPGRARAGARAALDAASAAVEGMAFGLEGATTVELFGRRHVALSVEAAAGRRVATLSGLVAVEPVRSIEEAGALAALRAIDRWIAW